MKYIEIMKCFEADDGLNENTPNLIFLKELFLLLVVDYLLVEVTVVGKLHDDAIWADAYHRFLPSKKTSL